MGFQPFRPAARQTVCRVDRDKRRSAPLAGVEDLSFDLDVGTHGFVFFVAYRPDVPKAGLRIGLTAPPGYLIARVSPTAGDGLITASGQSVLANGPGAVGDAFVVVQGIAVPTEPGRLQLEVAPHVASSAATIREGSHGVLLVAPEL